MKQWELRGVTVDRWGLPAAAPLRRLAPEGGDRDDPRTSVNDHPAHTIPSDQDVPASER
jgi:hypothetical protein